MASILPTVNCSSPHLFFSLMLSHASGARVTPEPHPLIPTFIQVLLLEEKTKHSKVLKGVESQFKKQGHSRGRVNSCSIFPRTVHEGWRPTASEHNQGCPAKGHQWFYLEQLLQNIEVEVRRAEGSGERRVEPACQGKWVMLTLRQAACEGKVSLSYGSGGSGHGTQKLGVESVSR